MKSAFFISIILELAIGIFILLRVRKRLGIARIFIALGMIFMVLIGIEGGYGRHSTNLLLNFCLSGISILWLIGIVAILRMVREHQESLVRLKSLQEVDQAILSSFSNNGVMNVVMEKLSKNLSPDGIGLFVINKDGRNLNLLVSQNLEPEFSQNIIINQKERLLQSILNNRGPLLFKDDGDLVGQFKSCIAAPVITKGGVPVGILTLYSNKRFSYNKEEIQFINGISRQIGIALDRERFIKRLEEVNFESVLALVQAIEIRDSYTRGHSLQVANLSFQLGKAFDFSERELQLIRYAGLLHDVGKIAVPESILQKPGPLSDNEWKIIKQHPEKSARIIEPLVQLQSIRSWIHYHHERWDGRGYPAGLKGNRIPLNARILSVCDTYSAMISDRPYRKRFSRIEAKKELQRVAGTQLDPTVVKAFLRM